MTKDKVQTIDLRLTLQDAVVLWGYLDARPEGSDEALRWVRDRLAREFAAAVNINIESAAKAKA